MMFKNFVAVLCTFLATSCLAQTGKIVGRVVDEEGEPSKGDSIYLISKKLVWATSTDNDGEYTISNIRTGIYQIRLAKKGYRDHVIDSISVKKNRMTELNIRTADKMIGKETSPIVYTYREPIILCAFKDYPDISVRSQDPIPNTEKKKKRKNKREKRP
ncbi:MAG: carboxypeptidase regulatory-like domain-containing protein [Sphingobacteriales bacterium]|nr:MAG: carboxypeptidase regulatory-like domain-containing protein [Sphingobacteriales bacterium]